MFIYAETKKQKKINNHKLRSKIGQTFDRAVQAAVRKGEHREDAAARIIVNLIDGDKDVARVVAATPIGGTTVVEDIVASQVESGRQEFERGLDYIVDRGTFSHKTYSDSVQPTINAMTEVINEYTITYKRMYA